MGQLTAINNVKEFHVKYGNSNGLAGDRRVDKWQTPRNSINRAIGAISMTSLYSFVFAFTALIVGLAVGAIMDFGNANAQNAPAATVAVAPKVAYLDFLKVLKSFSPLQRDQAEISMKMEIQMAETEAEFTPKIEEVSKVMTQQKPETRKYRDAMDKKLDLQHRWYEEQLLIQQAAQAELRDAGIEWFGKLKSDASQIAKKRGYTQVLNIVLNHKNVAAQNDLKILQQQLLVSPVLYFDKAHDITKEVEEFVTDKYALHITMAEGNEVEVLDKDGKPFPKAAAAGPRKDADYFVPFGTELKLKANILKKGEPATGKDAEVAFRRIGIDGGKVFKDGKYIAPDDFPRNVAVISIRVSSKVDPQVQKTIRICILDKAGFDKAGYDKDGFDKNGYDKDGLDKDGKKRPE